MQRKVNGLLVVSMALVGMLAVGLLALSLAWPGLPVAQARQMAPASAAPVEAEAVQTAAAPARSITVVGEGRVKIKPDVAQTNIGVEIVADTIKEASGQVSDTMNAIMTALKAQGIEDRDMQTSGYNIWVERPYSEGMPTGKSLYHVSNTLNVTIRNLDKVGAVLDAAIEAGANNIYGVTFSVADPSKLMSEARGKATEDALAKAGELAQMHGVTLGDLVSVSEVIAQGGYYAGGLQRVMAAEGMGGGAGPITPGELEMMVQLQVTYAIK